MTIDTTRPHIGRIYDYMLGGHHNYEADRQAAAIILQSVPSYPKWARLNRWFLQYVANEWAQQGISRVLDLGSGLPTEGHFNDFLPEARILFSDYDPLSVAYGEEILRGKPNMKYVLADVTKPEQVLAPAATMFGSERKLGIGCIGVAYFMPDEALRRLMQELHAFCAPGSIMALTMGAPNSDADEARLRELKATFMRLARIEIFLRSPEHLAKLVAPWRVTNVQPIPRWLDVPDMVTPEEHAQLGAHMTGALLVH